MASTLETLLLAQVQNLQNTTPQLIGTTILSAPAPSITIPVPAGFNQIQGIFTGRQDTGSGGAFCFLRLNGDSTAGHYTWQYLYGSGATSVAANANGATATSMIPGVLPGSGDTANYFGTGSFELGNVGSAVFKPMSAHFQCPVTTSNGYSGTAGGLWAQTAVVTSVTLLPNSGNLVAGSSLTLYGLK